MIPQHLNPVRADRTAIAPYNFVPLPEKIVEINPQELPDHDRYLNPHHSGYIECQLVTESPLYVRGALTLEKFEELQNKKKQRQHFQNDLKNTPDFFYTQTGSRPVIPGSSIRGCLRQLVEMVAYGKIDFVTNQKLVYRAVGDTTSLGRSYRERLQKEESPQTYSMQVRAGYMFKKPEGVWEIIPAKKYPNDDDPSAVTFFRIERENIPKTIKHWPNCANSWTVYFKPEPIKTHLHNQGRVKLRYAKVQQAADQPGKDLVEGVVVVTGKIPRKHMEFVFNLPDTDEKKRIQVPEDIVTDYREQITKEQEQIAGKINDKDEIEADPNAALKNMQPVFYLFDEKQNKLVFFGHAMMFRLPYLSLPHEFVPEALRDVDDETKNRSIKYDLAEALFGYVKKSGSSKERAYASRIAITDATLAPNQDNENIWLGEETNNHVVVPSILAGPKPTTFQHYLVQTNPDDKRALYHWASKTPVETMIRGHKLYWHKGNISLRQLAAFPAPHPTSTQHTQMKPVRSGVRFSFRIYFDNLSDVELGALLWALDLPGEAGHEYRHKIGMGKPLGMGAVKIMPVLHLIDRKQRYRQLFDEQCWFVGTREANDSIEPLIKEFESFVLAAIGAKGVERLSQVDRIRMLLKMHEWPGPDSKWTRYMEIERPAPGEKGGKLNEYKERPVLPDPLNMSKQSMFVTGEQERLSKNVTVPPQPAKLRAKAVPPKPISEKAKSPVPDLPAPAELFQELKKQKSETGATPAGRPLRRGDKVKAEVLNKLGNKVTVRLQDSTGTEVSFEQPYYPYRLGENVQVKVVAIDEKTGRVTKVLPA